MIACPPRIFSVFGASGHVLVLAFSDNRAWIASVYLGLCVSTHENNDIYGVVAVFCQARFFHEVRFGVFPFFDALSQRALEGTFV